jgi:hypothetical protein
VAAAATIENAHAPTAIRARLANEVRARTTLALDHLSLRNVVSGGSGDNTPPPPSSHVNSAVDEPSMRRSTNINAIDTGSVYSATNTPMRIDDDVGPLPDHHAHASRRPPMALLPISAATSSSSSSSLTSTAAPTTTASSPHSQSSTTSTSTTQQQQQQQQQHSPHRHAPLRSPPSGKAPNRPSPSPTSPPLPDDVRLAMRGFRRVFIDWCFAI